MNIYKMFYLIVLCLLITGCSNKNNDIVLLEKTIEDIKSDNIQLHELNNELSKKYKQSESKRKEYSEDLKESLMKVEELDNIIYNNNKIIKDNANYIKKLEDKTNQEKLKTNIQELEVFDFSISPNGQYAVIIITVNLGDRFPFLYNMKNGHSEMIDSFVAAQTYWSPDSKYFILDEGTGRSRWGSLYLTETKELIENLRYRGRLFWLDSGGFVFTSENTEIKIDTNIELDCTTDIVKYNIDNGEHNKLFEGSSTFYFYIKNVKEDGTIEISKNYVEKDIQNRKVEYINYTAD